MFQHIMQVIVCSAGERWGFPRIIFGAA